MIGSLLRGFLWLCWVFLFLVFFFNSSSKACGLDSVNGKALNKEQELQEFHLQFMPSQKYNICSVVFPYKFSGSQKNDPHSGFGWKYKVTWGEIKDTETAEWIQERG